MKKLLGHLYDQTGACPECGRPLRPVRYYTGAEDSRTNLGTRQVSRGTKQYSQTSYNVNYTDIREHRAGFCDACDQAEWDAKEANWPKPSAFVTVAAIAGIVLFLVGLTLLLLMFLRFGIGSEQSKKLLTPAFACMGVGAFTMLGTLDHFIKQTRAYSKHKKGFRAPYVPKTEAELSNWAKNRAKPIPSDGRVYWNLTEFETMQKLNGNYFL